MLKTIIFDFGNVVSHFDHHRTSKRLAAHTDLPQAVLHTLLFSGPLEEDYESGRLSTEAFLRIACDRGRLSCPASEFIPAYTEIFWPNPHVCELVPRLKPAYRLLLLSNTNDLHARYFCRLFEQTLSHFDGLVLSHEVGARKPSAAIYAHAQRLAQCEPAECLFIDDLAANVAGARDFGWQGIVYGGGDLAPPLAAHGVHL
jgi:putative hydrolase of the HAD superfamily